jgi:hypothetical protein
MNIYNLDNPAYLEARGLAKVWKAYADYCNGEDIMEVGFNANSGYVYIALEHSGISIGSAFGKAVEFIVTDFETGEEFFEETLFDAEARLEKINKRNYG